MGTVICDICGAMVSTGIPDTHKCMPARSLQDAEKDMLKARLAEAEKVNAGLKVTVDDLAGCWKACCDKREEVEKERDAAAEELATLRGLDGPEAEGCPNCTVVEKREQTTIKQRDHWRKQARHYQEALSDVRRELGTPEIAPGHALLIIDEALKECKAHSDVDSCTCDCHNSHGSDICCRCQRSES